MKKLLAVLIIWLAFSGCRKNNNIPVDPPDLTVAITGITRAAFNAGTAVTLTGRNFGNSTNGLSVLFNGSAAFIQSVSPTQIKVLAPQATSGKVTLILNGVQS